MEYKKVVLKKDREDPIKNKHHWIFSGAIAKIPSFNDGEIMAVESHYGEFLGHGYFNSKTDIAGRMLNFDNTDPLISIRNNIKACIELRKFYFRGHQDITAHRLINGEGEALPGLTVDRYDDVLVLQSATAGMDALKPKVVEMLLELYDHPISCIYERSSMPSRTREGLLPIEGFIYGEKRDSVIAVEHGIKYNVDFINGQKTGLFLDMEENKKLIMENSLDRTVLNCFSYVGGFSLSALKGGAKKITSVDISESAIKKSKENFVLNGHDISKHDFVVADAFDFLRDEPLNYDLIILDPPSFAKKREEVESAKRGYHEINKTTLSKMPKDSFLLTCSCSYHVDELTFERIIAKAAKDAKREIRLISKHRLAHDHPINIYHPEFNYLKSLFIYVV
ncbi:MAG: class I SAM-dependent rRNA methyltransferase [bacterium]